MSRPTISDLFENLESRLFDRRLIVASGCWLYIGALDRSGYAKIRYKGKVELVHRISAHLYLGLDLSLNPRQHQANHKKECFNHNCFNPEHLYIGNQQQNLMDASELNSLWMNRVTHCPQGHEYTPDNLVTDNSGKNKRLCLTCHKVYANNYTKRKRQERQTS